MHTPVQADEGRPGRLRLGTLFIALAAAIIALTSCAGFDDEDPPTAPPLESATTRPAPTAEPTQSSALPPPALPANADAYADAAVQAWTHGDTAALAEFAAADVLDVLEANIPEDPGTWASAGCDAATGQLSCAYQGPGGEILLLLVDLAAASAAQPHAVIEARFA